MFCGVAVCQTSLLFAVELIKIRHSDDKIVRKVLE